jgi:hypothetical protein
MKNETYEKLFDLSYRIKDGLVTPFILDYFSLEAEGVNEPEIVMRLENRANLDRELCRLIKKKN